MVFPGIRRTWGRGGREVKCGAHCGASGVGPVLPGWLSGRTRVGSSHSRTWITGPKVAPLTCCDPTSLALLFTASPTGQAFPLSFGPAASQWAVKAERRSLLPGPVGFQGFGIISAASGRWRRGNNQGRTGGSSRQSTDSVSWTARKLRGF